MKYLKMLKEIDLLVNNDWAAGLEMKLLPKSAPYTQLEAKEMADTIAKVYSVSHATHCKSCGAKYTTPTIEDRAVTGRGALRRTPEDSK